MGFERFRRRLSSPDFRRQQDDRYTLELFETLPSASLNDGFTAPAGAIGSVNIVRSERHVFEQHIKGAGQTIIVPTFDASGYNISLDQTNDEGMELTQGITARSRAAFVVGTDPCFFDVTLAVADVSGTDDLVVGFRTAEAYQANVDDYNNMAAFNLNNGDVLIETIDDNAATTTTDTTDNIADTIQVRFRVEVPSSRVVRFLLNQAAPTVTQAFTWDNGDTIVPFVFFLHSADVAGTVHLRRWECGLL